MPKLTRGQFANAALAVLLVIVVAVVAVAVRHGKSSASAAGPPAVTTLPTLGAPAPSPSATPPATVTVSVRAPLTLFFGDSYTRGQGAPSRALAYPALTAKALGWPFEADGVIGTGYVPTTGHKETYAERKHELSSWIAKPPQLIVLQGGLNDASTDERTEAKYAAQFVGTLRAQWPGVPVVMFGPVQPSAAYPINGVTAGLRDAAAATGCPFVDASTWISDANRARYIGPDLLHPNAAGHAYIAAKLTAALRKVVTQPR